MDLNDLLKAGMSALGGGQPGQTQGGISPDAMGGLLNQVLGAQGGGLDGLVSKFNQAGMGDVIKGWISTGPNPAISADQLKNVLGNDMVANLAKQAGIDPTAMMGQLSAILPGLVDKMTPAGTVPPPADLQGQLGGLLGSLFGKK